MKMHWLSFLNHNRFICLEQRISLLIFWSHFNVIVTWYVKMVSKVMTHLAYRLQTLWRSFLFVKKMGYVVKVAFTLRKSVHTLWHFPLQYSPWEGIMILSIWQKIGLSQCSCILHLVCMFIYLVIIF